MPKSRQPKKRAASIEAILDAAENLILRQGFRGTSVDDIASKAGFTKGAVYFYFRDKQKMLMAVLSRVRNVVLVPLVTAIEDGEAPPTVRLVRFLDQQAKIANSNPEKLLMTILLSIEFNGNNSRSAKYVRGGYTRLALLLEQLIKAGQRTGEFRRDMYARELASVLLAVNDGVMLEWLRHGGKLDGARMALTLRQVLCGGACTSREAGQLHIVRREFSPKVLPGRS